MKTTYVVRISSMDRKLSSLATNIFLSSIIFFNIFVKLVHFHICLQTIHFNEKNPNELILNDKLLTILNELKILFHDDTHKQMGYPLQLHQICAILLYCKSYNIQFNICVMLYTFYINMKSETELYCGLKNVRLENIKEIKKDFISHVSTFDDIQVVKIAQRYLAVMYHSNMNVKFCLQSQKYINHKIDLNLICIELEILMKHLKYCLNLNNGTFKITMNKITKKK
ncbi:hypothetical protein RFI_30134 [Reticulomyxa filosa]|uniref:Uncharacterized protein n=1 Tax=Reticulomyxa filosa TaxID=46433 RepID=X6LZA0_RETFI|nr:hypothetical protein RFI_30134 [Reticulomyxa filosa]|eukprot:ETO07258.1 hypothetical protein RFI_30134 [Reticulomyxa filosa]